jgi:hypothetical protein
VDPNEVPDTRGPPSKYDALQGMTETPPPSPSVTPDVTLPDVDHQSVFDDDPGMTTADEAMSMAGDPLSPDPVIPTRSRRQIALDMGVLPDSDLDPKVRWTLSMGVGAPGSDQYLREAEAAIRYHLGEELDATEDDTDFAQIEVHNSSNGLMYKVLGEDDDYREIPFSLLDPAGFEEGDTLQAAPGAAQIVAEVAVGVVGAYATIQSGGATLAPAILMEAATAFGTELLRIKTGRDRGLPISDEQMWHSAKMMGAISAFGGTALPILFAMAKRLGFKLPGKLPGINQEEFEQGLRRYEELADEFHRTTAGRHGWSGSQGRWR